MKTHRCALLARSTKTFTSFLFGLLLWLSPQLAMGQPVYNGNVTFTTQAEVDAWSPAYTSITGFLNISGADISDLTPLQNITSIGGSVIISGAGITSLNGLSALTSVGGNLTINENAALTSLTGLTSVISIGGYLGITSNTALTSLTTLNSLTSIGTGLYIFGNASLTSITGLNTLTSIGGDFSLYNNTTLTSVPGLNAITSIGGHLYIYNNSALTSLSGLGALTSTGGFLYIIINSALTNLAGLDNLSSVGSNLIITDNPQLSDCCAIYDLLNTPGVISGTITIQNNQTGCDSEAEINAVCACPDGDVTFTTQAEVNAWPPACTSISGSLTISGADITDLTPLGNITSVGGTLQIQSNPALTSLTGLNALTSIGEALYIASNAALTSLTGLNALTSIEGELYIISNGALTSLSGLDHSISIAEGLSIQGNGLLSDCTAQAICNYLSNPLGSIDIQNNATGCNYPEIYTNCNLSPPACPPFATLLIITQAQIDNFQANSPSCTSIAGNVIISGSGITNLNGLSALTFIGGHLHINGNTVLTGLTGLNALTSIGGGVYIQSNAALTSLTGLNALTSIGGQLYIEYNSLLTSLAGLNTLTSIGGDFQIEGNSALTSLTGLNALTSIGGTVNISFGNSDLTSLTGLNALTSIGGILQIQGNQALTSLTGLNALTSIGGALYITSNAALTSLMGLNVLASIGGELQIYGNVALTSLTGLDALTSTEGDLNIQNNSQLTDCCAIYDLLNTPGAIGGSITIQNNQTGCDSQAEINTYCDDGDLDNDGYTVDEGDCDDNNAAVHPGALEICGNATDDDCDGLTDEEYTPIKIHKDGQQNVSCYGGSDGAVNIHATGGQAPYSFEWSNGATTEDATGLSAGAHTVTVVDVLGRCRTKSFTLTQPSQLTLTFTHKDVSCHGGSDGEATAQPGGGSGNKTYLWNNGETTKKINDLSAGTYSVTVTDAKGCTVVGSVVVGEPAQLLITNVTVTPSGGNYQLTVSATGGNQPYKYRRSKPNGNWTNWQTSNILTNVPAGAYTIQVKDNNACIASVTLPVPGGMLLPPGGADDRAEPQVSNDKPNQEKILPEAGHALLLYPNPARNQLSVLKRDYAGKKAVVTITNNLGVPMLLKEVEAMPADALTLDLSGFQDGLYFLTVRAEGFPAATKRFVVVR